MRKTQHKTISPEEQEEQNFQRSLAELREQPIHNPTVKYEIGEDGGGSGWIEFNQD
jgi:hypothetical protein